MIEESQSNSPGPMIHLGLFLLRLIAGTSLIMHWSWAMVYEGWRFFWSKGTEKWSMITAANELNLPQPIVCAVIVSIIFFFGAIFLIAGLLGRITSGLLLVSSIAIIYAAFTKGLHTYSETSVLYSGIFLALFAMGHGKLSLDRVIALRPKRRRPSGLQDLG
jgi:uncharacterized membrane protein YphA (DoxX/SURF4 family)